MDTLYIYIYKTYTLYLNTLTFNIILIVICLYKIPHMKRVIVLIVNSHMCTTILEIISVQFTLCGLGNIGVGLLIVGPIDYEEEGATLN